MSLRKYNTHSASSAAEISTIAVMLFLAAVFAFFKTTQVDLKLTEFKFETIILPEGPVVIPPSPTAPPPPVFIPTGMDAVEEPLAGDDPVKYTTVPFDYIPPPPVDFTGIEDIKKEDAIDFILVQEKPILSSGEKNKLVQALAANFPELAKKSNTAGKVKLSFICSTDGIPTGIEVVSETPKDMGFGEAAVNSLKSIRFTPGYMGDKAVAVRMSLPLVFSLSK